MKILLVDDEKSILQVIGDFLSDCGYDVILAGDGSEALQRLEELEDIGLIISDIRMPKMDGLDLLKAVRVRFPGIPATLMTGHGDEQLAIDALQEGAQGYLKKPLKFDDLLEHIAQVEARDHLEEQVLNEYNNLLRGKEGGALGEPSAQTDDFQGERANLLVLYADRDIWESAGEILEAAGHQVQFAASAEDALKLFANNIFDVVLCEVDSADFSCLDAIGKIRASDPALVAILLTAKPESEMLVRALEVGVSGLLEKPFTGKELKARVARALAERKRLVNVQHLLGDLIQGRGELRQKIVVREHHLSQLIDAAPFGVVSTEGNGSILSFNRQAEKMYGYQEKDILGCDFSVLLEEGDKKTLDGKIASAARSQHRRKDGKPIAVLVRYRIIQDDNNQRAVHLYIIEDLTKREEMESQLIYAEKMSLLGQLAPRIAHEFGTPLQLVSGNLDLASWELEKGNSTVVLEYLDSIRAASEQMNGMVKQMLNIGKPVAYVEKKIELELEVEKALDTLGALGVTKRCKITREFAPGLPRLNTDPEQVGQVFLNLIVNAAQAMERVGERELKLVLEPAPQGGGIQAIVSDTGTGISEEDLEQIFQPFFTTKEEGKGTGLGLPIVKLVMDRCNGSIEVDSQVGKGTEFRLFFPIA